MIENQMKLHRQGITEISEYHSFSTYLGDVGEPSVKVEGKYLGLPPGTRVRVTIEILPEEPYDSTPT